MAIELPHVLKNMNLFVDGRGYAGRVDEIQLPKLTLKTEEHRAGGMDIPVELELGMDKLEAELTISDLDPEVFKLFGLLDSTRTQITLRGAIQAQGTVARPVIVNLAGGCKEIEASAWKPGDKSTLTLQVAAHYLPRIHQNLPCQNVIFHQSMDLNPQESGCALDSSGQPSHHDRLGSMYTVRRGLAP